MPVRRPREFRQPTDAASKIQSTVADRSETVLNSDMASAPATKIIPAKKMRSATIGRTEIQSGGVQARRFNKFGIFNCLCVLFIMMTLEISAKLAKIQRERKFFHSIAIP